MGAPLPNEAVQVNSATTTSLMQHARGKKPLQYGILALFSLIVLIGLGFGFISSQKTPQKETAMQNKQEELFLTIQSPASGEAAVNGEILVRGQTLPHATVLMYTDTDDASIESDSNGYFENTLLLEEGDNTIVVTSYDGNGGEKSMSFSVTSNAT